MQISFLFLLISQLQASLLPDFRAKTQIPGFIQVYHRYLVQKLIKRQSYENCFSYVPIDTLQAFGFNFLHDWQVFIFSSNKGIHLLDLLNSLCHEIIENSEISESDRDGYLLEMQNRFALANNNSPRKKAIQPTNLFIPSKIFYFWFKPIIFDDELQDLTLIAQEEDKEQFTVEAHGKIFTFLKVSKIHSKIMFSSRMQKLMNENLGLLTYYSQVINRSGNAVGLLLEHTQRSLCLSHLETVAFFKNFIGNGQTIFYEQLQILVRTINAIHEAGLVHTEIKLINWVLKDEESNRFVLDGCWCSENISKKIPKNFAPQAMLNRFEGLCPEKEIFFLPASDWYNFGCMLADLPLPVFLNCGFLSQALQLEVAQERPDVDYIVEYLQKVQRLGPAEIMHQHTFTSDEPAFFVCTAESSSEAINWSQAAELRLHSLVSSRQLWIADFAVPLGSYLHIRQQGGEIISSAKPMKQNIGLAFPKRVEPTVNFSTLCCTSNYLQEKPIPENILVNANANTYEARLFERPCQHLSDKITLVAECVVDSSLEEYLSWLQTNLSAKIIK